MKKIDFNGSLNRLGTKISEAIWKIRAEHTNIVFNTIEDLKDENFEDDYFEMRNDITGNVFDVHLMTINKKGIKVVDANDFSNFFIIGINDLLGIEDRILLYESIIEKLT